MAGMGEAAERIKPRAPVLMRDILDYDIAAKAKACFPYLRLIMSM